MKQQNHTSKTNTIKALSEEMRLELLNLAVMFRSHMIGKDEFMSKAEDMGIHTTPETILNEFDLVHP